MDMVERVARAIIRDILTQDLGDGLMPPDWDGKVGWLDQGETDIVTTAKAAIRAMMEGLEPVAYISEAGERLPVYDLSALKELLNHG